MPKTFKASDSIFEMMSKIKAEQHPELEDALIAIAMNDSKPFIKNRLNLGNVRKFSDFNKLWQNRRYDFSITLCIDVWQEFLNESQQEALLDLHLTRCEPVYEPEVVVENGKKIVVKDDFGRVKFTDVVKIDDDGNPKWQVLPLDIIVVTKNIKRFGLWYGDLIELEKAVLGNK